MAKSRTVKFVFDPFEATGEELPKGANKERVMRKIAERVREDIITYAQNQISPVQGYGKFPALSKKYAIKKSAAGLPPVPDLTFDDEMLNAITESASGNRITIKVSGKQGAKADGHCNHSGESELPLRRFIPSADEGETLKAPILNAIKRIIRGDE